MTRHDQVFVLYPRGLKTGGPEALHQLVDSLRRQGQEAYLVAHPETRDRDRVGEYAAYDAPETEFVDAPGAAVVVPEVWLPSLANVQHATPYCWWLSIDNAPEFMADWRHRDPWRPISHLPAPEVGKAVDFDLFRAVNHLTQSHYAWSYLFSRVGVTGSMLSDQCAAELPCTSLAARA